MNKEKLIEQPIAKEDYQKVVEENVLAVLSALDVIERRIIYILYHSLANNSRDIHLTLIEQFFESAKKKLSEKEIKEFDNVLNESRTRFYQKLNKIYKLPSYATVKNKLETLYESKLILKRKEKGKIKETWYITPRFFNAIKSKREEVLNRIKHEGLVVDPVICKLLDLVEPFEIRKMFKQQERYENLFYEE